MARWRNSPQKKEQEKMMARDLINTDISKMSEQEFNISRFLFIYFERKRETASVVGAERGKRENPKQASCCQHRPDAGIKLMNCEIMT